jgi:hypothetical protein
LLRQPLLAQSDELEVVLGEFADLSFDDVDDPPLESEEPPPVTDSPDEPLLELEPDSLSEPEPEPVPPSDELEPLLESLFSSLARVDRADDPRSFFAHPLPLKWIAGATNAFVIVPSAPHSGQNLGPWSLMPWMTSVTRRHAEHV